MPKSPFIEGFKQPTLSKNSHMILSDVRGDGENKLLIWCEQQNQIIVYKGTNRQLQKPIKLKNVNGIIQYYDQETDARPVIALSAENALYIFRGLSQSFRLRIPDIFGSPQQQLIWSQYQNQPQKMAASMKNLGWKTLSQTAKYFVGSTTIEKKRQLISKAFSDGINQKDSISAMTVIKESDSITVGNIVIGTQLSRLYILDTYGHSIIDKRIINFVPSILLAHGSYTSKYIIISIGRQGLMQIYGQGEEPMQTVRVNTRVVSAVLSFPDFITASADQVVTFYTLSNSNFKIAVKKAQMKLNRQPLKLQVMKCRSVKCLLVAFQDQFRIYNENVLIYTHKTNFKLYSILYGSFSREEGCLILLYEKNGFEVLILHRQFNPKESYATYNKKLDGKIIGQSDQIPFPKKTSHFMTYWKGPPDDNLSYKHYEKNIRMLKWRTLKQRLREKGTIEGKVQVNSKILGMGPVFIIKLQIQNISNEPIYQATVLLFYQKENVTVNRAVQQLMMIAPFTPYSRDIEIRSESRKSQLMTIEVCWGTNVVSSMVNIPNCEEVGD